MIISLFDSIIPGITQLGSLWLPMSHIMLAPFVANDLLFQTGLADTFVSSISTGVTNVLIFRLVKIQFNSKPAGLLYRCSNQLYRCSNRLLLEYFKGYSLDIWTISSPCKTGITSNHNF